VTHRATTSTWLASSIRLPVRQVRSAQSAGDLSPALTGALGWWPSLQPYGCLMPTRVFISWAGDRAGRVAILLHEWLPRVLQATDPWISIEISAGERWAADIGAALDSVDFGIAVLTRASADSRWLNFECGAISKHLDRAAVVPLLVDFDNKTDLTGPLTQFQMKTTSMSDVLALCEALNRRLAEPLPGQRLREAFDIWWPQLRDGIADAIRDTEAVAPDRSVRDEGSLLREILELVRGSSLTAADLRTQPRAPATLWRRWEAGPNGGEPPSSDMAVGDWVEHPERGLGVVTGWQEHSSPSSRAALVAFSNGTTPIHQRMSGFLPTYLPIAGPSNQ